MYKLLLNFFIKVNLISRLKFTGISGSGQCFAIWTTPAPVDTPNTYPERRVEIPPVKGGSCFLQ